MFMTIWKGLEYYMVIYFAYLTTVPKDLWEAAEIDGANTLQKHLAVTVPYMMLAITFVAVMSLISAMKVFVEIYVMTQGGPLILKTKLPAHAYRINILSKNSNCFLEAV